MLLDLWGLIGRRYPPGVGSSLRSGFRAGLVIVEVDGRQYRVPEGELQSFLKNTVKKVQKKAQKKSVVTKQPEIVIIKAPSAVMPQVAFHVEQANDELDVIWQKLHDNLLQLREDDDIIALLLGGFA